MGNFETSSFRINKRYFNKIWPHYFFGMFGTCIWHNHQQRFANLFERQSWGKKRARTGKKTLLRLNLKLLYKVCFWMNHNNIFSLFNITLLMHSTTMFTPRRLWFLSIIFYYDKVNPLALYNVHKNSLYYNTLNHRQDGFLYFKANLWGKMKENPFTISTA